MRVTHEWEGNRVTIRVEGLRQSVKALLVGDLHLGVVDERDPDRIEVCSGMGERFHHRHNNNDADGNTIPQETAFVHILEAARQEQVDVLALVGDVVDFPAVANVEYAKNLIDEFGIPSIYTPGNHDWLFVGEDPIAEVRREFWPRLDPLTGGEAAFSRLEIGGLQFVSVDNSIYQVDEDQLESTRQALAQGLPTILLSHIPISLPTLRPAVMELLNVPLLIADPDWPVEARRELFVADTTPATREFVQLVCQAQNLVAVLAGHIHLPHVDSLNPWAVQYLAPPGFAGEYLLFEWQPL
jgi:3',5'-cyclic AMP phosphodiesterase CpdA